MAAQNQYTPEFREQAVRLVFESMEPDETRAEASRRLAGKMSVSPSTLYGWVKKATPAPAGRSVLDLLSQLAARMTA